MRFTTIITGLSAITGTLSAAIPTHRAAPTANLPQLKEAYSLALESVGAESYLQNHEKRQGNAINIIANLLISTFELTIAHVGAAIGILKGRDVASILDNVSSFTPLEDLLKETMTNSLEEVKLVGTPSSSSKTTTTDVDRSKLVQAFNLAADAIGAGDEVFERHQRRLELLNIDLVLLTATLDLITNSLDSQEDSVQITEDQARTASEGLQKALQTVIDTADVVNSI